MLSSSRARKIFLAQDLIENQARIVKSYVRTDDFDHWCYAASELVDLMIDLARRDEKYLQRDGLSTPEESHCQIVRLNSQYVNSVSRLTFEIVFRCLYPKLPNSDRHQTRDSTSTTTTSPRTTPAPPKTPEVPPQWVSHHHHDIIAWCRLAQPPHWHLHPPRANANAGSTTQSKCAR